MVKSWLKDLLPLNSCFKFSFESYSHNTNGQALVKIPCYRTKTYGRYSVFINAIYVWNCLQSCHQNVILHQL